MLEAEAHNLLNEEEIGLVLMSITTAKSQSTYWFENTNSEDANNGRVKCVNNWRQVGISAVGGALGGAAACGGSWLLGFGPVGWKALGACAIAGGIGVAVEDMVSQCLTPKEPSCGIPGKPDCVEDNQNQQLTPNSATYETCMRWSGGNPAACGGYLPYTSISKYAKNPYSLLKLPVRNFP